MPVPTYMTAQLARQHADVLQREAAKERQARQLAVRHKANRRRRAQREALARSTRVSAGYAAGRP
ncbi:MAG TPA: hypothetical protein VM097_02770 [Mycobacteriales bacterium]|nr:hypothetical protein [Mycobacteriales bacterium]